MSRTTLVTCAGLLTCGLLAGVVLRKWIPERCTSPTEAEKARLMAFVRIKYKLPPTTEIGVADGGVAFGSCFRKLVFASLSGRPFHATLFTSPDFRFLTNELLNARPDPKEAEKLQRETAESLVRGNSPVRGIDEAPATVAVFSDFQCPYCARMAKTLNEVADAEGDRMRVIYRYFPLSMHSWARPAAEAAACAQRENNSAFWSFHDFLFAHQRQLSVQNFGQTVTQWARAAPNLNTEQFERCVKESLTSGQIDQDIALGNDLGVHATPSVFLNGAPVDASSPDELLALIRHAAEKR
jgi:protein-disulfide isomerase